MSLLRAVWYRICSRRLSANLKLTSEGITPGGDLPENEDVRRLRVGGREFVLIGTAHVSQESADLVRKVIEEEKPDRVCVELDDGILTELRSEIIGQATVDVLDRIVAPFRTVSMDQDNGSHERSANRSRHRSERVVTIVRVEAEREQPGRWMDVGVAGEQASFASTPYLHGTGPCVTARPRTSHDIQERTCPL